uniref:Ubiquitin-like protease family profile domain-containing protein n=1 Tax=Cyclopterus lumpus TaxID=8103 RepID=A0A8C2ZBQ4_CYCLU
MDMMNPLYVVFRLIQYPAAPCKGRITVTKEDLACLSGGEFLNDVIIDFYLKFLLLEGVGGSVAERSHVFSSFFYKQLSRRRKRSDFDISLSLVCVPMSLHSDRHMRHQRVKTWTHHFFMALLKVELSLDPPVSVSSCQLGTRSLPDLLLSNAALFYGCSESSLFSRGLNVDFLLCFMSVLAVLCRPCVLVMDSLKCCLTVCTGLSYLQVEWEVHRGTPRLFTADSVRSSSCRVPQQDNSSDCGLYLLQYAESFLQNPVVHFDLPLRLDNWFPRQRVRQKREEIRTLIMKMPFSVSSSPSRPFSVSSSPLRPFSVSS